MKLPWIARSSHEEMVGLLAARVRQLEASERLYIDRLAVGGPIFATANAGYPTAEESGEPAEPTRKERFAREIARLSHRPSRMAEAITRGLEREDREKAFGPH